MENVKLESTVTPMTSCPTLAPSEVTTLLSRSSFHLLTASKVARRVRSNTTKAAAASLKNICKWPELDWARLLVPVVYSRHVAEPLLARDVPQLQPHHRVLAVVYNLNRSIIDNAHLIGPFRASKLNKIIFIAQLAIEHRRVKKP